MHLSWILGGKGLMNRRTFFHLNPHSYLLFAGFQKNLSHEQRAALGGFCGIQEAGLVVHQPPAPPCFQQFKTAAAPLDHEVEHHGEEVEHPNVNCIPEVHICPGE